MHFDASRVSNRFGECSIRLVSKLLLAAGSVAFVTYLLTLLPGIDRVVPGTSVTFAAVVQWTVVLAATLLSHRDFAELAVPLLGGDEWLYDVAFLLLAFPVVVFVTVHLYRGLDPSADLLATRFTEDEQADAASDGGGTRSRQHVRGSEPAADADGTEGA